MTVKYGGISIHVNFDRLDVYALQFVMLLIQYHMAILTLLTDKQRSVRLFLSFVMRDMNFRAMAT